MADTNTEQHMDDDTLTRLITSGGLAHFIGLHNTTEAS